MASTPQPVNPEPAGGQSFVARINRFWQRVTDGLELNQLWNQFHLDARSSYRLYSREVDSTPKAGQKPAHRSWEIAKQFFWSILEKLSPARRVLLLLALLMLLFNPEISWSTKAGPRVIGFDLRLWGGLLIFLLLILEVADRVVMKRDLQIARQIQTWLLPVNPPAVPGMEIAFATRPANTVAGDYYDVYARATSASAGQNYLIAVADVAGKSIPAALLMATFQASLKTLSITPSSLAELVEGLNRYACGNSQGGLNFTTAFLAEYKPATRGLICINAGHNWPILRRNTGQVERLEAGGLPLGITPEALYETATTTLEIGDWLVVFTDGLVEAVNEPGMEYGEERLISILNAGAEASPATMLGRIMADLERFVGNTPQHDDITYVLIKAV